MLRRLLEQGCQARMLDMMSLAGERTSRIVGGTYVNVAKYTPRLFAAAYRAGTGSVLPEGNLRCITPIP